MRRRVAEIPRRGGRKATTIDGEVEGRVNVRTWREMLRLGKREGRRWRGDVCVNGIYI